MFIATPPSIFDIAVNSSAKIAPFTFAQIAPSAADPKIYKPAFLLEILYLEESTYPHITHSSQTTLRNR
jgi:hypothetical protein